MNSKLQLDICCLSCCGGAIWWTLKKERQAWCCLQVKLCDPCMSALCVPWCKKALYKYSSFPLCLLCYQRTSNHCDTRNTCNQQYTQTTSDGKNHFICHFASVSFLEVVLKVMVMVYPSCQPTNSTTALKESTDLSRKRTANWLH